MQPALLVHPLLFLCGLLISHVAAIPTHLLSNISTTVNLRVEGEKRTIFEAPIFTSGHVVTTRSGGSHQCNGLNLGANPKAGPTCTSALDDASKFAHFPFDGTFDPEFDDFFITSIGGDTETATQFWGLLLNFQFTPVGGCQQEVRHNDEVLWAFDAFNKDFFLKLVGPQTARIGQKVTLTVTDGTTGVAISGASITGLDTTKATETNAEGKVTVTFSKRGLKSLKASRDDSLRSNALNIQVV